MSGSRYHDGTYLADNPDWHAADAPYKARWIAEFLESNGLAPRHVSEIGTGSGQVLRHLAQRWGDTQFRGYDISPDALAIAAQGKAERVEYAQRDVIAEGLPSETDLLMAIDVFEHVEDYMGFVRAMGRMAEWKLFHIPLDLSVQALLRNRSLMHARASLGHLHYFCRDTALATLADCGLEVVDWRYTHGAEELPGRAMRTRLFNLPRRLVRAINEDFAVRVMGGASMLVLAR
ncbi:class I SAM-dependent methyltransferase [Qipengyuania flava]|uniref:class I SAM-dependent methyltransferase n=1 Tax=Qipengyuania flava TaxID=192812 RepID=UPI001C639AAA|nr:class I SAM-dependent methyltransferase [Qipengyuania flava]QYJ07077.1 class I SAM-dependent methyltransferase [Qipengyuania flava]